MLRRLPAAFSFLMLGALGLRMGVPLAADLPLVALALVGLAWRQPWVQRGLAGVLALGGAAWLAVAWMRVQERLAQGLPWHRLLLILGAVALFTAASAWGLLGARREGSPRA